MFPLAPSLLRKGFCSLRTLNTGQYNKCHAASDTRRTNAPYCRSCVSSVRVSSYRFLPLPVIVV